MCILCKGFRYLGYLVTNKGFLPDPKKIEALVGRNPPRNVKEVKSFVCLGSYFRKFLERYSDVVESIQALVKKGTRWEWKSECQESFERIKSMLTNARILKQPEQNKKFVLSTDASITAVGAVLEQENDDGELQPVAYYSRKLQSAERNYMYYEREGLALVSAIKNFRPYLLGRRFVVFTDNSAIASIFKQSEPTGRLVRWIHLLYEYDCEIKYRAGKDNPVADYLSRPGLVGFLDTV
ncbi:Retrovirus-related Pol polyprotein from transposon [Smittium culicis]|uniref:Retrovirus-related Pol polyprotein from transposon n=1 Tax=Smittium culicis TaxID=133412 RepID=A0A1R1X2Q7_9FUNG|nr:Retrovirus-related Pol polyprotein from transposon [Smittium culicis]